MRFFPRTAHHRLLAASVAGCLTIGAATVPLAQADDLKDRQHKVEKKIDHADHALDESSSRLRAVLGRLRAAQTQLARARAQLNRTEDRLAAAQRRDREMRRKLAAARARLEQAQSDLEQGQADLEEQKSAVTDMVTSIYEDGDPQLQAFSSMLTASDSSELTWTQEGRNVMLGRETRAMDELHAAEVLLEVREQQLTAAEQEVEVRRQAAADHLVVMRDLTAKARAAKRKVREVVVERRDAKQQAARVKRHDLAQLRRLRHQEQRIKQKILARARRAAQSSRGYSGATGGFLSLPVPGGTVTSPYGYRVHPIYGYYSLHNGTDFRAYCGTPLHAAAGGTVVARYYSSVYGNRLYVSVGNVNGKNLTIVYNHATSYNVGVGQHVSRGQVLGYSGTTGWSTACHLHFIVMVNGTPVNPMNWM